MCMKVEIVQNKILKRRHRTYFKHANNTDSVEDMNESVLDETLKTR